jgi:hypothetical protein
MEKLIEKIKKVWSFLVDILTSFWDEILTLETDFKNFNINFIDFEFDDFHFDNISSNDFNDSNETPLIFLHTPDSQFYSDYY